LHAPSKHVNLGYSAQEETKDLTPAQRADRVNKLGEAAAQKYGFNIVASAKRERKRS